jgi:hypothetical protein
LFHLSPAFMLRREAPLMLLAVAVPPSLVHGDIRSGLDGPDGSDWPAAPRLWLRLCIL